MLLCLNRFEATRVIFRIDKIMSAIRSETCGGKKKQTSCEEINLYRKRRSSPGVHRSEVPPFQSLKKTSCSIFLCIDRGSNE
jgi:hypothetical protein